MEEKKISITIKQLESLLNEQKSLCWDKFRRAWEGSDMRKELKKIDPEEKIINQMHDPRDSITAAEYPKDFQVLKKYLHQ